MASACKSTWHLTRVLKKPKSLGAMKASAWTRQVELYTFKPDVQLSRIACTVGLVHMQSAQGRSHRCVTMCMPARDTCANHHDCVQCSLTRSARVTRLRARSPCCNASWNQQSRGESGADGWQLAHILAAMKTLGSELTTAPECAAYRRTRCFTHIEQPLPVFIQHGHSHSFATLYSLVACFWSMTCFSYCLVLLYTVVRSTV